MLYYKECYQPLIDDIMLQVVKTNWEDKREFSQIQKGSMSWIFRNSFCQGGRGNLVLQSKYRKFIILLF